MPAVRQSVEYMLTSVCVYVQMSMSGGPRTASLALRPYQTRIIKIAEEKNTVVILPTGAGKTLVAAEVIRRRHVSTSVTGARKSIFFVPTCLLVVQQANAIRTWTQLTVAEYMGGLSFPTLFDVLVTTPQAFEIQQGRNPDALSFPTFDTIVFDECHHVLKEHPYRKLAVKLGRACENLDRGPRVLGLTASVTYAVEEKKVEKSMKRLCQDMRAEIIATANESELNQSGYHALGTVAEVPYLDLPIEDLVLEGVLPFNQRKPHLLAQTFFSRIDSGQATPFARDLFSCIKDKEIQISAADPTFLSPLQRLSMKEWGAFAHKRVPQSHLYASLEHWYEALRLLVVSWEEAPDATIAFLCMNGVLCNNDNCSEAHSAWPRVLLPYKTSKFPRFERLRYSSISDYCSES
jgi:hypothetical protein